MSQAEPVLTVLQQAAAFGVSDTTIYNWRDGKTDKTAMPKRPTVTALMKWADRNGLSFKKSRAVLKTGRQKPGPKATTGTTVKRNAAGKLTGIRTSKPRG